MKFFFGSYWQVMSHKVQTFQIIAHAIGYPSEIDGKTLFLKLWHM